MIFTKEAKIWYEPDVLVCGLGPAGICAAVSAARNGMKVLGVEKCGYTGGNITNANVTGICGAADQSTGELVTGGIARELLIKNGVLKPDFISGKIVEPVAEEKFGTSTKSVPMGFDAEKFKVVADRLLCEKNIKILYHAMVADVVTAGTRIESVIIASKSGLLFIKPKYVVDCTGDADVANWSGVSMQTDDTERQAGTMMFVAGGVDVERAHKQQFRDDCSSAFWKANREGKLGIFGGPYVGILHPGVVNFNTTRVDYDNGDAESITFGEIKSREDIDRMMNIMREEISSMKNAYLLYSGPCIGARETRRIKGVYTLTEEDIYAQKSFKDCIGKGGWPLDMHNSDVSGPSSIKIVGSYDIPYRTLVPEKIENLLVAGRCHSVSHIAAASTRVSMTAMVMGEAAGTACAIAAAKNEAVGEIDINMLRERLYNSGAIL